MTQTPRPPPRHTLRNRLLIGTLATVLIVPALALALLLNVDWNKARPWLDEKTSEAIGRPFHIAGALALTWERPSNTIAARDRGWRDWLPWPHLLAHDIHIGNPAELAAIAPGDMASVGQLSFSLNPLALLDQRIVIPVLRFDAPVVQLLRTSDKHNNWTFRQADHPSPWKLELQRVVLSKGNVHLADALEKLDIDADLDTIDDPNYGVAWRVHGSFNGAPVSGSGKAGAVLSLEHQDTPYPLSADLHVGSTHIAFDGSLTKPTELAALDLRLHVAGASMARLYALTGVVLPETPAFATDGRLLGTLGKAGSHWVYQDFTGRVGESDIAGKLDYRSGQPRGMLSGAVVSKLLRFADLAPLIGADSNASKSARGVASVQPAGKVLPVEPFRTERWTSVDADVRFTAERIVREKKLPISKLSTHLILKDGVLTLTPLEFEVAGGNVRSTIELDGSGRGGKQAIAAKAKISARHVKIKQLFPTLPDVQASVGEINGDAQLSAVGNSVASLLAASNGELKTLINQGSVSKLLLEELGLNIGNIVLTKLFGDRQIQLHCMAADFAVNNGVARTRSFIIDTDEAVITVSGSVDLAKEELDLTLKPNTKSLRVFSLRAPIYLRGPFIKPDVSIDKGVLALRAGGALALATVAPVAALLPLVNAGPGHDSDCGKLLAEARSAPVAPPPGKRATR